VCFLGHARSDNKMLAQDEAHTAARCEAARELQKACNAQNDPLHVVVAL
jgi:hypothetical protein